MKRLWPFGGIAASLVLLLALGACNNSGNNSPVGPSSPVPTANQTQTANAQATTGIPTNTALPTNTAPPTFTPNQTQTAVVQATLGTTTNTPLPTANSTLTFIAVATANVAATETACNCTVTPTPNGTTTVYAQMTMDAQAVETACNCTLTPTPTFTSTYTLTPTPVVIYVQNSGGMPVFNPGALSVPSNTPLTFSEQAGLNHSIVSSGYGSPAGLCSANTFTLAPNQTYFWGIGAPNPGTYYFHCNYHSSCTNNSYCGVSCTGMVFTLTVN
jgi:hypothetical protein